MRGKLTDEDRVSMVTLYLEHAYEMLEVSAENMEHTRFNTAVNRAYYACFYAATGLLLKHQYSPGTHQGVYNQFSLHFVRTGLLDAEYSRIYGRIFDARSRADYNILYDHDLQTAQEYLTQAHNFVEAVQELIKK